MRVAYLLSLFGFELVVAHLACPDVVLDVYDLLGDERAPVFPPANTTDESSCVFQILTVCDCVTERTSATELL